MCFRFSSEARPWALLPYFNVLKHSISTRVISLLQSGEANFIMGSTRLTIGGCSQPGIARNVIDLPSNAEKGLSHRFLWVFPKPLYCKFDTLERVNQEFSSKLGMRGNVIKCQ